MDNNQPATKQDLQVAQDEIAQATNNALTTEMKTVHTRIDGLDSRMDNLDSRMDGLEKSMETLKSATTAILNVVDTIEARLKSWEQIPDKVERLHKRIFSQ